MIFLNAGSFIPVPHPRLCFHYLPRYFLHKFFFAQAFVQIKLKKKFFSGPVSSSQFSEQFRPNLIQAILQNGGDGEGFDVGKPLLESGQVFGSDLLVVLVANH